MDEITTSPQTNYTRRDSPRNAQKLPFLSSPFHDTLTKFFLEIPVARKLAIKELLIYKNEVLEEELWASYIAADPDSQEADGKSPGNFEWGEKEIE